MRCYFKAGAEMVKLKVWSYIVCIAKLIRIKMENPTLRRQ